MGVCAADGCERDTHAKGLCKSHYNQSRGYNQYEPVVISKKKLNNTNDDYDFALRLVELVLIVSDVHTMINQALIVEMYPDAAFPKTTLDLLIEVETLLRSTWRYGTTDER
jgi:hypothetical protein